MCIVMYRHVSGPDQSGPGPVPDLIFQVSGPVGPGPFWPGSGGSGPDRPVESGGPTRPVRSVGLIIKIFLEL